jgi:DNA-binding transcriptional ArsR family regulator
MKTTLPRPIPPELAELIAARLRAIGDPTRLRLLDALRDGERSVQELTDLLGAGQQNVSKHLGVLHGAGIVSRRKVGTSVRYAVADPAVYELCEQVCGSLQAQLAELTALVGGNAAR